MSSKPIHPGVWLKDNFKGDRTYHQWLVADVNDKFPNTNINPQYWDIPTVSYLNGKRTMSIQIARVLAAATGIKMQKIMQKDVDYQIAYERWRQESAFHVTSKYIADIPTIAYNPAH